MVYRTQKIAFFAVCRGKRGEAGSGRCVQVIVVPFSTADSGTSKVVLVPSIR
jgi:hypothetical protein